MVILLCIGIAFWLFGTLIALFSALADIEKEKIVFVSVGLIMMIIGVVFTIIGSIYV